MLPLHQSFPGAGAATRTNGGRQRQCLPPRNAQARSSQNPVDFPPEYLPPGTRKYREQQRQRLLQQEEQGTPLTPQQQQQHLQRSPSPDPPGPSLQKLASSSEQRQQSLQEALLRRQRPGPNGDPASSSPRQPVQSLLQAKGRSLSDSQLDTVATQCLTTWFAGAPAPAAPKPLQPGILDHKDPHVVCQAITALMDSQQLEEAVKAVTYIVSKNRTHVLGLLQHKPFMMQARTLKASRQAFNLMRVLPPQYCFSKSFTMALDVCAEARDLATGTALFEMAERTLPVVNRKPDLKLMTTYIKVCKSAGNADRAYSVFLAMKQRRMALDAHVYCALIAAFGEAMHRELTVAHERKDQYVLLERAYSILMEAEKSGVALNEAPWNAVLTCAGRCGQLRRGFEILDLMQQHSVEADVISLGSIVEACVLAGDADLALKVFNRVLSEGFEKSVELYTQAVSACKLRGAVDLETALKIYAHMQLNKIQPDKKFFAALIATAGAAGRLDLAFEMLADVQAEGVVPGSTVCSGLILACIKDRRFHLAQKVYDLCAKKGIYPTLSLFNNLMDWYASEMRLGDVARLLTDMTKRARLQPNMNTYRVLLNACQRTNQGALAFEVYEIMKAKRLPILQERLAQSLYYLLVKCCFNQQRYIWADVLGHEHNLMAPWRMGLSLQRTVRMAEAEQVLQALGSTVHARGSRSLLLKEASVSTWATCAVSVYRDMAVKGWKPNYDMLNMLLNCMRMPLQAPGINKGLQEDSQLLMAAGVHNTHMKAAGARMAAGPHEPDLARAQTSLAAGQRGQHRRYDGAFDSRAVALVEDAIARYALPRFTVDKDFVVDLRSMPPTLAEVYVMTIFTAWERRAARARTQAGINQSAAGSNSMFFHRLRLLVPPFQLQSINWPSYLLRQKDPSFSSIDNEDTHQRWRGLTDSGMSSSESDSEAEGPPTPLVQPLTHLPAAHQGVLAAADGRGAHHVASSSGSDSSSNSSMAAAVGSSPAFAAVASRAAARLGSIAADSQEPLGLHSTGSGVGELGDLTHASAGSRPPPREAAVQHELQQQQQQQQQHLAAPSHTGDEPAIMFTATELAAAGGTAAELAAGLGDCVDSAGDRRQSPVATGRPVSAAGDVVLEGVQGGGSPAVLLPQQQQQQLHMRATCSSGSDGGMGSVGWAEEPQHPQRQQHLQHQQQDWAERVQQHEGGARMGTSSDGHSSDSNGSSAGGSSRRSSGRGRKFQFESPFADRGEGEASTSYDQEAVRPRSPGSRHRFPKHISVPNNSKTGSAVAATCLRMKVFANFNPREGIIDLTPTEIVKWVHARHIWQLRMRGMLGVEGAPQGAVAQSTLSATRDEIVTPSIEDADAFGRGMVPPASVTRAGAAASTADHIPAVVQQPGARQSARGGLRAMGTGGPRAGRLAGGRVYRSADLDESEDSDAERNDFGAWSPVPRKGSAASRLQQQQRDIRLGLGPQVRRPPARMNESVRREDSAS